MMRRRFTFSQLWWSQTTRVYYNIECIGIYFNSLKLNIYEESNPLICKKLFIFLCSQVYPKMATICDNQSIFTFFFSDYSLVWITWDNRNNSGQLRKAVSSPEYPVQELQAKYKAVDRYRLSGSMNTLTRFRKHSNGLRFRNNTKCTSVWLWRRSDILFVQDRGDIARYYISFVYPNYSV